MTTTVLLGGAGKTGRRVARRLMNLDQHVRLASRSTDPRFDWHDESTWDFALDGAQSVYIAPPVDPDGLAHAVRLVKVVAALGIERLVLLSGRGVGGRDREFDVYRDSLALEVAVRENIAAWSIVQPAWFAQNLSEDFLLDCVVTGDLRAPAGDGAEAFVDADDVADVVTACLTDERHVGCTYPLSGPRLLTFHALAEEVARASGRAVRYTDVAPEQYVDELVSSGVAPADAHALVDLFAVIRNHLSEYVSDGVERALRRPPRDVRDALQEAAAAGAWS